MSGYGIFSQFYDGLTDNIDYRKRAEYIRTLLIRYGVRPDAVILDIGCGTGKMTAELSALGYDMIGTDPSPDMLCAARDNAYDSGQDIMFLCQSAEELDLYGTVDAAVSTLDVINHLDGAECVKKAFYNAGLFMNPDGVFIFDVNTQYKHRNILGNNTFVYENDDVFCVWQNSLNEDLSVDIALDFFELMPDGSYGRSSEDFCEYSYSIDDLVKMLEEAQFEILDIFDDMTCDGLKETSQRAVIAARYTGKRESKNG